MCRVFSGVTQGALTMFAAEHGQEFSGAQVTDSARAYSSYFFIVSADSDSGTPRLYHFWMYQFWLYQCI